MSAWSDFIERARLLLFRKREERELAEELRFHVEMETEKNLRLGMSEYDARKQGLLSLGGVELTKEQVRDARGTRLMHDSFGDVALAIRALRRSPAFAIVSILTLAVGIGATTAVFSAVDAVLLQPLPYQQPGQLVRLYQYDVGNVDKGFVTPVHYLAYRERMTTMSATAATYTYSATSMDIGGADRPERIQLLPVSADYFDVVRVHPELGRGFRAEDEAGAKNVVLSHARWLSEMNGDVNAIGKTLIMSGEPFTVVGVMPADFHDPVVRNIDAWVPSDLSIGKDLSNAGNHMFTVIGRLRPTVSIERAQAELDVIGVALSTQFPDAKDTRAKLYPLKEDLVGSSSRSLRLMMGAVGLVLMLVCVNIANLLLVRGSERAREFALRSALGAQRSRLIRQLLIESLTLSTIGAVCGIIIARIAISAMVTMGATSIPQLSALALEPRLLLFAITIGTLSAIIFGLIPALRTTRAQPSDVLREQSRSSTGSRSQGRLREALVVSQVALAFVLLSGAGILTASFRQLQRVDLGVNIEHALTFDLRLPQTRYDDAARARFFEEFATKASQLPGVTYAAGVSRLPATGRYHSWGTQARSGPTVGTDRAFVRPTPDQRMVTGSYFQSLGIKLLEGRMFDARDALGTPQHVIITKNLALKIFPGVSAIGQTLAAGGREAEVVGVVSDVALDVEGNEATFVFHPHAQYAVGRNWELSQIITTSGNPSTLITPLRNLISQMDPQLVMYNPMPLADAIGRGNATRVFVLRILTAFAAIALALSALGLFGVLSYGVKLRSREFGIRIALGANRTAIRGMVMRRGLTVTAVGIAFGLGGAIALSRVMASMVFKVKPLDPSVLVTSTLFMCAVACVAAFLPAYRATSVDPREVLQGE